MQSDFLLAVMATGHASDRACCQKPDKSRSGKITGRVVNAAEKREHVAQ
jgi:hypothetical protein